MSAPRTSAPITLGDGTICISEHSGRFNEKAEANIERVIRATRNRMVYANTEYALLGLGARRADDLSELLHLFQKIRGEALLTAAADLETRLPHLLLYVRGRQHGV